MEEKGKGKIVDLENSCAFNTSNAFTTFNDPSKFCDSTDFPHLEEGELEGNQFFSSSACGQLSLSDGNFSDKDLGFQTVCRNKKKLKLVKKIEKKSVFFRPRATHSQASSSSLND